MEKLFKNFIFTTKNLVSLNVDLTIDPGIIDTISFFFGARSPTVCDNEKNAITNITKFKNKRGWSSPPKFICFPIHVIKTGAKLIIYVNELSTLTLTYCL